MRIKWFFSNSIEGFCRNSKKFNFWKIYQNLLTIVFLYLKAFILQKGIFSKIIGRKLCRWWPVILFFKLSNTLLDRFVDKLQVQPTEKICRLTILSNNKTASSKLHTNQQKWSFSTNASFFFSWMHQNGFLERSSTFCNATYKFFVESK